MVTSAAIRLNKIRLCLEQVRAADPVYSLPRLHRTRVYPSSATLNRPKSDISDFGWRDREGACKNIEAACKESCARLTPSPTLPRKRGREQTEFAARAEFHSKIDRVQSNGELPQPGAIPLSLSSLTAFAFFDRCASPIPRSTFGALVNWMFS